MCQQKWSDLLNELTQSLKPYLPAFHRNEAISICMTKRELLLEYIKKYAENRVQKSADVAFDNIKAGDDRYNAGYYSESLSYYSQAVIHAPRDSKHALLAYVKRSRVLEAMKYFKQAIIDTDIALSVQDVGEFSVELQRRKAICLVALGEDVEENTVFSDIKQLLKSDSQKSEKKEINDNVIGIQKLRSDRIEMIDKRFAVHGDIVLPNLKGGRNPNFSSASNCLQGVYSENKGRHVLAKCDIKKGDVLFVEKPFSFIAFKSVCTHCCEEIIAPTACWHCLEIQFCSEECRRYAWQSYHKYECGFYNMLSDTGIAYLAIRVIFQAAQNVDTLKSLINDCSSGREAFKSFPVENGGYKNVYNLQEHLNSLEIVDLLQYAMTASLLSLYIVHFTSYATDTVENFQFCATIILKHIVQLISNAHAITGIKLTDVDNSSLISVEEQEQIASAIYPSASMMNHSCDPSIINSFYKCYLVVRACKDIGKGEEVFNSYGPNSKRMKRSERQQLLQSQYHFKCNCSSCTKHYDTYDVLNSLKCEKCAGPLMEVSRTENFNFCERANNYYESVFICYNCNNIEPIANNTIKLECQIRKLMKKGDTELYERNDPGLALKYFMKAWTIGRKILFVYHKDLSQSAHEIAQCLFRLGDFRHCFMFLKGSVVSVGKRFGEDSIELAFEAKKFGDIINFCFNTAPELIGNEITDYRYAKTVAIRYYEISLQIFRLLYGTNHPVVEEIVRCMSCIQEYNVRS